MCQGLSKDNIPEHVWNDAMVKTIGGSYFYIDIVWAYLRDKLLLLSSAALNVLTISRSNVVEEHAFSMIKKQGYIPSMSWLENFTEFSYDDQSEILLLCCCPDLPDDTLKKCRNACYK